MEVSVQSDELLSPRDAARSLGISYPTLKQWIYKKKLRSIRTAGGHHRIPASEIERFLPRTEEKDTLAGRRNFRRISGRNQLVGRIVEVRYSGLLAQVKLSIGGQRISSIITADAAREMRLEKGQTAAALIKAQEEAGGGQPFTEDETLMWHPQAKGLAQLHQLRGRVGRGAEQSYCILVTERLNDTARERIRTLVDTSDGFQIAEMDLKLRGPGEFLGTRQSGLPSLRIANILRDQEILEVARAAAQEFAERPATDDELMRVMHYVHHHWQRRYGLVEVG